MATCLDIITYALETSGILPLGKSPKDVEANRGLVALQSLYDQWRTGGMFGTLEDVTLDEDDTAQEGKRYYVPAGVTLTDATNEIEDPDTLETRQPRDLAMYEVLESDGTHTARLYDRKEWVDLLGLELADTAPLSGRSAYGLAACLVTSGAFVATFKPKIEEETRFLARQFTRQLMQKGGSTQDRSAVDYF